MAATVRIIDNELPVGGDIVMGELKGREGGGRGRRREREGKKEGERRGGMGEWIGRGEESSLRALKRGQCYWLLTT